MRRSNRMYPSLPEATPPSQNMPPPLRYESLPESNPSSRIYPLLHHYMRHSHNLPLPPRIYPPLNIHMRLWDTPGIHPSLRKHTPLLNIYTRASRNLLLPPRIYLQAFSTMWFSQNLPLSPAWISVHSLEGAYTGLIYHPWGLNVFSVLGLWQCRPRGVTVLVADPGSEERGRTMFWGLAPKSLAKIGGEGRLLPLSILDFTNLCANLGLEVAWRTFHVPAGEGGGCERTQRTPPSLRPWLPCSKADRPNETDIYIRKDTQRERRAGFRFLQNRE